jgi:thiol:disulfide interchange protein
MKKIVSSILLIIAIAFGSNAQNANPVKWNYTVVKTDNGTELQIHAAIEKGWHIFTAKPGGDDLAIPTEIKVEFVDGKGVKNVVIVGDRQANQKPTKKNIEGMGIVNYFENDLVYKTNYNAFEAQQILIHITYQTCNDQMCLPPTDVDFTIDTKKTKIN